MTLLSRLKGLIGQGRAPAAAADPMAGVRWIPAEENPFGVELLDCRSYSQSMLSATQNPGIAESFVALRTADGEHYRGRAPADSTTCACDLRYPHKEGRTRDGPLFKAASMEDKWDIYLYDGRLFFARSWTGELAYRATIVFHADSANIVSVEAPKEVVEDDPFHAVAAVDFLNRSHLYRLPIPHPLPKSLGRDPRRLVLFSFSQYGRRALYGSFADTTQLHMPAKK